ncbi:MAG: HD domain-containing protein [Mesorhizobium sp.]|nr:HD domain-containing phosphohydrolase [Mesorhizobium sp.]MBL8579167.1 HD domain-containing protein [Mesorhizobium sp.]
MSALHKSVQDRTHPGSTEDLTLKLSMARGVDEILATVREYARPLVGADGITFVLRDGDRCHYAEEDAISPLWKGQRFPLETCISGWSMLNRQAVVIEDIYADPRIPHAAYRPTFVKSLAMVPVRAEDPVAAIGAYWATRRLPSDAELSMLQRIANIAAVAMTNVALVSSLVEARDEAVRAREAIILAMASLAETRDNETGNHVRRTQHYVRALAEELFRRAMFRPELDEELIDLLYKSAPLHDIGKVGIPDRIMLKPGKLDADEFAVMKTHAELGWAAISKAERNLGTCGSFFRVAKEIAWTHHERWDGSGYPRGLRGRQIPLPGRLMAIADVYDALVSKRVYKPAIPHADAVGIIIGERGRHFDPDLVDVFVDVAPTFDIIFQGMSDQPDSNLN